MTCISRLSNVRQVYKKEQMYNYVSTYLNNDLSYPSNPYDNFIPKSLSISITTRSLFVRSKQLQLFFSHFFFSFLFFKLIYSHGFHPVYTTRIFLELISQRFSAVYSPPCHFCSRNIPRLSPRRRNRSTIFFIYARRFIDDCTRQRLRANGSGNGRRSAVGKTVLYYFSRGR